ncbi:MAG: cytochrome c maturation protein CcmE [Peptococcaceae bacterium]|nr:cytochrome c maturation protein CcmE [Peptococcaceae bacterium]
MTKGRMKRRHMIYLGIVVVFIVISVVAFAGSVTPYVTFDEAKARNTSVQVRGDLVGEVKNLEDGQGIAFDLKDDNGTVVQVVYKGIKQDNMDHADGLVVQGKIDGDVFCASKILVKCPSKYESKGG